MRDTSYIIEVLILYGALTLFAILGVNYLAPMAAEYIEDMLVKAAQQK